MASARVLALLPRRSDWAAARRAPAGDFIAGSTVALVALPLALAFGVTSGLGAEAGLITAIVAGAIAAVFGGSNLQVSGPTGAMTVVIVPVVHQFGPRAVLMVGAMAGLVLVALALARVGRYVRYLPMPVIEGFTAGIAVVIALQQIPAALGDGGPAGQRSGRSRSTRSVISQRTRRRRRSGSRLASRLPSSSGDARGRRCRSRCSRWPGRHCLRA